MTKREFLDIVFALAPNEANEIMDAFDEYVDSNKIDCDKMDKCEKLQLQPVNSSEIPNNSDAISRQAAIDALDEIEAEVADGYGYQYAKWREYFVEMPSAQPEIIRCRECKFASGDSRICMKFGHSPIGELDFCSFAERREVTE